MKTQFLTTSIKAAQLAVGKTGLKICKASPELLLIAGAAGTLIAVVSACKATLHLDEVLEDAKVDLDRIHEAVEDKLENYPETLAKKDITKVYVQAAVKVTKLYAPSIILLGLSMSTVFASNHILRRRNASLAAAYTTLESIFKTYRNNVTEEFGEETDYRMRHSLRKEIVDEIVIDEKGKEKKVKKEILVKKTGLEGYSDYAKFFDESCGGAWEENAEYNLMFLKGMETTFTNKLRAQGYVFLNEVYEALGIDRTQAGQSIGWLYDKDASVADNQVSFGIYDMRQTYKANRAFVNGYEPVILLDFNVTGNIIDKI